MKNAARKTGIHCPYMPLLNMREMSEAESMYSSQIINIPGGKYVLLRAKRRRASLSRLAPAARTEPLSDGSDNACRICRRIKRAIATFLSELKCKETKEARKENGKNEIKSCHQPASGEGMYARRRRRAKRKRNYSEIAGQRLAAMSQVA